MRQWGWIKPYYQLEEKIQTYGANKLSLHLQQAIFLIKATVSKSPSREHYEITYAQKALWKIFMFHPLIHPFQRHKIILLESRNFPRRRIVVALRVKLISSQQRRGKGRGERRQEWGVGEEVISIVAWYLMTKRRFYCNTPSHPFAGSLACDIFLQRCSYMWQLPSGTLVMVVGIWGQSRAGSCRLCMLSLMSSWH